MLSNKIIGIYCFVNELLRRIRSKENSRRKVSDSEIAKTSVVAAHYFSGHLDNAIPFK